MDTESRNPRILVVDDEATIAETLTIILNRSGFETMAAYDGLRALRTAKVWEPDLLLSDVMMPGINGMELALKFQVMYPNCKVLLFSGQASIANLFQKGGGSSHHFEILPKPVHPLELIGRLREELLLPVL